MTFHRMNWNRPLVLATCVFASLTNIARGEDRPLMPGDAAPAIEVREFVKGEPIKQFEAGKTYVVEFWATWCGPCLPSIPHLTELQKMNPTVAFIGVSVDEETSEVKTFVKEMGDKMDYRVAIDTRTKQATTGLMQKSWLDASLQDGIPVAFIVNKDGKLAWIGHPGELEEPLALIVEGKWDLAAEIKKTEEQIAFRKQVETLQKEFTAAVEAKKYHEGLDLIEKALKTSPDLEPDWAIAKFWCLILVKETELAVTYGNHLVDETFQDNPAQLLLVAGHIVRPEEFAEFGLDNGKEEEGSPKSTKTTGAGKDASKTKTVSKDLKTDPETQLKLKELAIRAAEKAADLTEGFPDITQQTTTIEVLAAAYLAGGEKEKATKILESELEALQEHANMTKEAMTIIKAQLKELEGESAKTPEKVEKPEKKAEEEKQKAPEEKKKDADK